MSVRETWNPGWSSRTRHAPTLQSISFPGRTYHSQESRFYTWLGTHHEGSRFKVESIVLLSAAPNSYNPALTISIRHSNCGACIHLFTHRFLQQPPLWDERFSSWSSSVGPEFLSAPDSENQEIRPRSQPLFDGISIGYRSKLLFNSSWTSLQKIASLVRPQHTWPSSVTLSTRSRRGATYDRQHKFSSWSLVSVRSSLVVVVSPSHHRNCGTYFQLTFDSIQGATTFEKETQNSLYAAVHSLPLTIYVTSAISTTTTRVRQGCVLSLFLFLLVIDFIMKKTVGDRSFGIWWDEDRLTDLDFADDIALLSDTYNGLQKMTSDLREHGEKVGLRISCGRTKAMIIGEQRHPAITIGQPDIEYVENFPYLGSYISKEGDAEVDVRARIGKAASVFQKLRTMWKSGAINRNVKLRMFSSIVLPTKSW